MRNVAIAGVCLFALHVFRSYSDTLCIDAFWDGTSVALIAWLVLACPLLLTTSRAT
jgi:hypothetical protein